MAYWTSGTHLVMGLSSMIHRLLVHALWKYNLALSGID